MKSSRMVALKQNIEDNLVEKASSLINTSMFIGSGLGGLIGAFIADKLTLMQVAVVDMGTFCISCALYWALPKCHIIRKCENGWRYSLSAWHDGWRMVKSDANVYNFFIFLIITAAFFKGFHMIARTVIPISIFNTNANGVTLYQVFTCLGLVSGSLLVYRWLCDATNWFSQPAVLIGFTAISTSMTIMSDHLVSGCILYFIFVCLFETTYTRCMNGIMVNCSKKSIPVISSFCNAAMMFFMIIVIVVGGSMIDHFGLKMTTLFLSLSAIALAGGFCLRNNILAHNYKRSKNNL
jgi:predicted MFS family arabinose efflux permease